MSYQGDFVAGATVRVDFYTDAGGPITLAGTPAAKVYKNDSTTESATGVTLTVDFDGVTGSHHVAIDTSADGTFYAAASDFTVKLTAGTVGGVSKVGAILGTFSIENRTQKADVRKWLGTTVPTPATAGYPVVLLKVGTGTGEVNLVSGKAPVIQLTSSDFAGSWLTAAGIAADAITAAKIADGAIDTATFATGTTIPRVTLADTATNLTNAATAGDWTATMKTSFVVAAAASAIGSVTGAVTVGTNNDKTGYRLSTAGIQDVWVADFTTMKNANANGMANLIYFTYTDLAQGIADIGGQIGLPAGASVSADLAAVKADTAAVKVKTDNLPAAPASTTNITTVGAVTDKTGFKLASDGLDSISTAEPTGAVSGWNFRQRLVWLFRRSKGKTRLNSNTNTLTVYGADGTTVLSTQTVTDSGGVQDQGEAA